MSDEENRGPENHEGHADSGQRDNWLAEQVQLLDLEDGFAA